MIRHITELINQGEGQMLDFKYCISDPRKIARSLSAFSNSDGGTLLIGVRDNGSIAGVNSDEEYYMIDTAARLFCNPEIVVKISQHSINGKNILEVVVPKGEKRPYKAKDDDGRWKAYFRQGDQNFLANNVMLQVWRRSESTRGLLIRFENEENILMEYLRKNESITLSGFKKVASLNGRKAERILSDFVLCGIIISEANEKGIHYKLNIGIESML
jgi:predicted HTH transcriptional regulator